VQVTLPTEKVVVAGGLISVALTAWWVAFAMGAMMGMPAWPIQLLDAAVFSASWAIGMIAMMFPTAVPMMLLFLTVARRATPEIRAGGGPTLPKSVIFITTYIAFWVATGVLIYLGIATLSALFPGWLMLVNAPLGIGVALVLVAAYQLSPVKGACLHHCHPTSFLYRYYRGGRFGAVRMGALYAKYCVGCCWVMMVFLVAVGAMSPLWMALFAALIFAERAIVKGPWPSRGIGLAFLATGVVLLFAV
jgi:predicted metal-binding membrane protein